MAKQIIWSLRAQDDRKQILAYWTHRNKSTAYSKKLNKLFKVAVKLIVEHPGILGLDSRNGIRKRRKTFPGMRIREEVRRTTKMYAQFKFD